MKILRLFPVLVILATMVLVGCDEDDAPTTPSETIWNEEPARLWDAPAMAVSLPETVAIDEEFEVLVRTALGPCGKVGNLTVENPDAMTLALAPRDSFCQTSGKHAIDEAMGEHRTNASFAEAGTAEVRVLARLAGQDDTVVTSLFSVVVVDDSPPPLDHMPICFLRGAEVLIMTELGDQEHPIIGYTSEWASAGDLAPSPDGALLAFRIASGQPLDYRIMVADLAADTQTTVGFSTWSIRAPRWSPDGQWLAYQKYTEPHAGAIDVFKVQSDGSGEDQLTSSSFEGARHYYGPRWSPDGQSIALGLGGYLDYPGPNYRIWIMDTDGVLSHALVDQATGDLEWRPGTSQLTLELRDDFDDDPEHPAGLYLVNQDGTGLVRLTDHASDTAPRWSPDGQTLLFVSERDGSPAIYRTDAAGSAAVRISAPDAEIDPPSWAPDGQRIVYASTMDGNWDLFTSDLEGLQVRKITNTPEEERHPVWRRLPPEPDISTFPEGR